MVICQLSLSSFTLFSLCDDDDDDDCSEGVASSRRKLDPHRSVTQSGSSRSVSPAMARRETRL